MRFFSNAILLLLLPAALAAQPIDLVTHNAVVIDASPAKIWPYIMDPSGWKAGAQLEHLDGEKGQAGERFRAFMPDDPATTLFHVTNVELMPERRRSMKLNASDGTLIGYASFELTPEGDRTRAEYHVYSQSPPIPGMDTGEYLRANYQRFATELFALQKLVQGDLPPVVVDLDTSLGTISLELYPDKAPVTVENFLRYVDNGHYDGGSFYRVVRLDNQKDSDIPIEVIQGGMIGPTMADPTVPPAPTYPSIAHESTESSGLKHVDGAISMARFTPGSASSEFFIVINDYPALDHGGLRNPDGHGFAVFGRVIAGMDIVRTIQKGRSDTPLPEQMAVIANQVLREPVAIESARRR